ncbi:MAG: hypothetical protein JSS40_01875 [Proteobacteria bacterium]|nr:hypothetical protein [Pseudomonadota bacterium]
MHRLIRISPLLLALVALGACTTIPSGPGVLVLPGTGKSFDEFRANEYECRQYASAQIGGTSPNDVAADNAVRNAAVGTAVGALAGAAIGGRQGAGVGAGTGLVVGAAAGSGTGEYSGRALQQRYDHAYLQCMYARGNRVPVSGRFEVAPRPLPVPQPAPQQPGAIPPPPPGNPPPPPPGYVLPPQAPR